MLWVTNIATPYRLPLWRELARKTELTVALLADTEPNRAWNLDLSAEPFETYRLRAPVLRASERATFYGPSLRLHRLIRRCPNTMVIDGWESPAYITAATHARALGVSVLASYRSTRATHRFESGPVPAIRGWLFRRFDGVIVAGHDSMQAVLDMGVQESRIAIGFNTVDVEGFGLGVERERERLPKAVGHTFLYVGQLIDRKNVTSLLRAFAKVREADDSLMIVGSGPLAPDLKAESRALGIEREVTFTGPLSGDGLVRAYALNSTLVLPSTEEVWGLVVNEGLASGLHAVVSEACGISSSVRNMPGVWVVQPTVEAIGEGMRASRSAWQGPIANHPLRKRTPEALAGVVLDAATRLDKSRYIARDRNGTDHLGIEWTP